MELKNLLAIIGVVVTAAFGVWGVFLTIKLSRYSGRITFVKEQTIALFDAIVKNLDELSITYKGQEIGHNIVLIECALVNTGKFDISPTMIQKPIAISLPENFRWLTAKIVSTSADVNAQVEMENDNTIKLNPGFFRCNEYIRFQALAEVPTNEDDKKQNHKVSISEQLEKSMQFTQRILNTRKIDRRTLEDPKRAKQRRRGMLFFTAGILLIWPSLLWLLLFEGVPKQMVYNYVTEGGNKITVDFENTPDKMVKVVGVDNNYTRKITLKEFQKKKKSGDIMITERQEPLPFLIQILLIFNTLMFILAWLFYYFECRRDAKLRRILEI